MHFFLLHLCCSGKMQTSYWLNRSLCTILCKYTRAGHNRITKIVSNGAPAGHKYENNICTVLIPVFGLVCMCIQKIGCNPYLLTNIVLIRKRNDINNEKKSKKKQCKRSSFVVFLRYCLWQSYRILFENCFLTLLSSLINVYGYLHITWNLHLIFLTFFVFI